MPTQSSTPHPLQVTGLSVAYQDRLALRRVDVHVPAGQTMAVIGPNGAGKSTLVKAAMGLVPTLTGTVNFFGTNLNAARRRVAYMPQAAEVDWDFPTTVRDVVTMGTYGRLGWFRRPGRREHDAVDAALEAAGITDLADRQISHLSGGQKQRAFVARTLVQDPELYIMDEPFAGVDVASERAITKVLTSLRDAGKTVVVVHHDLATVRRFCTWVTILNQGELVACGPLDDAFTHDNLHRAYGLTEEALGTSRPEGKAHAGSGVRS
ncbi:metal ABC transporter ATP-binding protein [Actinomyces trachealis]|uniref:metal ABC transporter ATP-binding protein n=1 Tax=Actinomyces trachealis TaxID=2763540 RepID=UPI001FD2E85D|nr:metal ABC transporter ATP-binding protein [Actinomyces trachealis]